ncbi:YhcN/YlaJ family sporulation lipoprotein [Paenibacillus yanchengensis]|uniref:YhcN/YlaJ family sporulation lipoprotein n=1 Tax=Paenibacillus yanchengensis TaxID=2035833 RepID=A0ABW4YPQ1_9BACL
MYKTYTINGVKTWLIIGMTFAVVLSGCGKANQTEDNQVKPQSVVPPTEQLDNGSDYSNKVIPNSKVAPETGDGTINQQQMKQLVASFSGVDDSEVALQDKDVLVGLEVNDSTKRKMVAKQVFSKLNSQYPSYNYYITTDLQQRKQIAKLEQEIDKQKSKYMLRPAYMDLLGEIKQQMAEMELVR